MSRAEDICFQALELIFIDGTEIIKNYRPDWLTNPATGKALEIDFYLPGNKICFEIQGPHHYDDQSQIERDNLKRKIIRNTGNILFELSIFQISPKCLYRKLKGLSYSKRIDIPLKPFQREWLDFDRILDDYKKTIGSSFGLGPCTISPNVHKDMADAKERESTTDEKLKYDPRVILELNGVEVRGTVVGKIEKSYRIRLFGSDKIIIRKAKAFKHFFD